ncbi:hypothetical protein KUCAC02_005291, partial [Chaenocephalus aceratus]
LPVLRGHPVTLHPQGCASTVSLSDSPVAKVMSLGQSGGFRWKSGQSGSLNSNSTKKNKENRLQKLSAGKLKIRVLKDEPPTAPPQPPPLPPTTGLRTTRKSRLRGTHCGQCEVKTAGIMCAECAEDYCIGCFTRFHQKGALKLHRMIPIQTDLQTHVSSREVVHRFQNTITPGDQVPEKGPDAGAQYVQSPPEHSQVLAVDQGEEKRVDMIEDVEDGDGFPTSLLTGEYNEEESTRSFQEALRQWRGDEAAETTTEEAMWTPVRPVSVVEFTENSLTYIDRLLLKKHRSHGQTPTTENSSVCEYSTPISVDHESTLDRLPSHFTDGIQNYPFNVKLEEELSIDSGDEMSSDSLGLDPHEEESSDEEVQMHRRLTRGRTREGKEGNPATSHSEDPFVPEDPHRGKDLQADEQEQLSDASVVNHDHSAGPGSERLCDPDGFPPQGLDMNSGPSDMQEHTHCDPPHTSQMTRHDSEQTGSTGHGPSSPYTEADLVSRMMKNKLAAQEIMDICSVDQMGCEDPDLDADTTAHTLHDLEQELRLMAHASGAEQQGRQR